MVRSPRKRASRTMRPAAHPSRRAQTRAPQDEVQIVAGDQQVARTERSAIREGAEHQAPAPDFAEPVIGPADGGDSLAPRNDVYNRSTSRWTACGKPVDDRLEKPVHLPCGLLGQSCEKPGYVSVHNAGYKPCARSRQPVNTR